MSDRHDHLSSESVNRVGGSLLRALPIIALWAHRHPLSPPGTSVGSRGCARRTRCGCVYTRGLRPSPPCCRAGHRRLPVCVC